MENKTFIIIAAVAVIALVAGSLAGRYLFPYQPTKTTVVSSVRSFAPEWRVKADVQMIHKTPILVRIHDSTGIWRYRVDSVAIVTQNAELRNRIDSLMANDLTHSDIRYSTVVDSTYSDERNPSLRADLHIPVSFYLRNAEFEIKPVLKFMITDRDTMRIPIQTGLGFTKSFGLGVICTLILEALIYWALQ